VGSRPLQVPSVTVVVRDGDAVLAWVAPVLAGGDP
jgi:hypothetical protein